MSYKTREQISFAYWFTAFVIGLNLCTAIVSNNSLNLSQPLKPFHNCTIHLMISQLLSLSLNSSSILETYNILPLESPAVLSVYTYAENSIGNHQCNYGIKYKLQSSDFRFPAKPMYKPTCIAQVYVDPMTCNTWSMVDNKGPYDYWDIGCGYIPISALDLVSISQQKHLSRNNYFVKHLWFFIQVQKYFPELSFTSKWTHVFFALDYGCHIWEKLYGTRPMKLVFLIHNNNTDSRFKVISYYSASFQNSLKTVYFERLKCMPFTTEHNAGPCITKVLKQFVRMPWRLELGFEKLTLVHIWKLGIKPLSNLVITSFIEHESDRVKGSLPIQMINALFPNVSLVLFDTFMHHHTKSFLPYVAVYQHLSGILHKAPFQIHFLSCTDLRHTKRYSWLGFISPFDKFTWLLLITCSLTTSALIGYFKSSSVSYWWQRLTFTLNLLLTQPITVLNSCKYLMLPWILVGILLSNEYHGDNVSSFVSQLIPKPLNTFEDFLANNFTLLSLPYSQVYEYYRAICSDKVVCEAAAYFGKKFRNSYGSAYPMVAHIFIKDVLHERYKSGIQLISTPTSLNSYLSWNVVKAKNELINCKRHAYVDFYYNVVKLYAKIVSKKIGFKHRNDLHISGSVPETYWYTLKIAQFPVCGDAYSVRFQSLLHSGLLAAYSWRHATLAIPKNVSVSVKEYKASQENQLVKPKGLTLNTNVVVVFFAWVWLNSVAILCFLGEKHGRAWQLFILTVLKEVIDLFKTVSLYVRQALKYLSFKLKLVKHN